MALTTGTKLGHFEVTGHLGAGGMGEVYRARDTKLGRAVAIKVLPEAFALDKERLARFEREARTLATLDHPNIGGLYDFQEAEGMRFLVMQLVEGKGLDERLSEGTLSLEEAVPIFIQIAEALEAAHRMGIVHRDLKPANIKVTPEGRAVVLDFGLAIPTEGQGVSSSSPSDVTKPVDVSPVSKLTTDGMILGTPSYMAPEQARGKPTDKRVDIWAFGCCLFEALSGSSPFTEDTISDTIAAVLKQEVDLDRLPVDTPWRVRNIIERCLEKDPQYRLRDIGDAWAELKKLTTDSGRVTPDTSVEAYSRNNRSIRFTAIASMAALLFGSALSWFLFPALNPPISPPQTTDTPSAETRTYGVPSPAKRFQIDMGHKALLHPIQNTFADIAISRDGSRVAYSAIINRAKRLYVHDFGIGEATEIVGVENAWHPFFSPDGEWIAYIVPEPTEGVMYKVPASGGSPIKICDAFPPSAAVWLNDDTIILAGQGENLNLSASPYLSQLYRVSANGGSPTQISTADGIGKNEWTHNNPAAIPGYDKILFTIINPTSQKIAVMNLDSGEYEPIIEDAFRAQYAPSGHIIFARRNALWAVPFDPESQTILGREVVIQNEVEMYAELTQASFAVSHEGSLIFIPSYSVPRARYEMVWVDHLGRQETIAVPPKPYWWPRVSPDGSRVAVTIFPEDPTDQNRDIWIHEFDRPQSLDRLTFNEVRDDTPAWSSDSRYVYFTSDRHESGDPVIYRKNVYGLESAEQISPPSRVAYISDISPDDSTLITGSKTENDLWSLSALRIADENGNLIGDSPEDRTFEPLIATDFNEGMPIISPDGNWVLHDTNEATVPRIYARPYPEVNEARISVTSNRGYNPLWSPDMTTIYYREESKMFAVPCTIGPTPKFGQPVELFDYPFYLAIDGSRQYDLEYPKGERFLMLKEVPDTTTTKIEYISNFVSELDRIAPHSP